MAIEIRADRKLPVLVDGRALEWSASPEPGIQRRMLERSGDEVALATTIVRYAANSRFPSHNHALGEEFLVLDGVFSDEDGDYPAGTYVRNPPGSNHAPFSRDGCVILVKLRQMPREETGRVRVLPSGRRWTPGATRGVQHAALFARDDLSVELVRLAPGAELPARTVRGGEEWFVVSGDVEVSGGATGPVSEWTWSRSAALRQPALRSGSGALLWMKRGHL